MNFEFSAEQQELRQHVRRFFSERCSPQLVRAVMDKPLFYDSDLWAGMADLGLLNITIPEQYGGLGLGYLELCIVAEEIGRAVAPVPFSSSVYLATEFLLHSANDVQKTRWLTKLASADVIGTLALAESPGAIDAEFISAEVKDLKLSGKKCIVADGSIADFAVVVARDTDGISLYLADLNAPGVTRDAVETIDPSRNHATVAFSAVDVELLGKPGEGLALVERVFDRAAVLTAFEQVGGAEVALAMGCDYARDRMAFGRAIGSFQAIKHMLANMYVSLTLARANAYFGAWALSNDDARLPEAAASARVSATKAYQQCAKDNIQVHGGMGFTWEVDCHLHYRRSNLLALSLGGLREWQAKLIQRLDAAA